MPVMPFDLGKVVQRSRSSAGITDGVPDLQSLPAECGRCLNIRHGNREDGGPVQYVAPGCARGRPSCRESAVQPRRALAQVPSRIPVGGTGGGEPQAFLAGVAMAEPIAGGAEIVVIIGKAVESRDGKAERRPRLALFGEGEKMGRVVVARLVQFSVRGQLFQPQFTD